MSCFRVVGECLAVARCILCSPPTDKRPVKRKPRFSNHCGKKLADNRTGVDSRGRAKLHADIAHPINSKCRSELQNLILQKYKEELERSRQPGYQPSLRDDFDAGPEGDGPESLPPPPSSESAALVPQSGKDNPPQQDGKGFGIFA